MGRSVKLLLAFLVASALGAMWHTRPRHDFEIRYRITYTWPGSDYAVRYDWCNWENAKR